ncbi:MAG: class I SAM-dependent methyltransferase [Alphaproteobacteria bacterium]|nr:MAG: class I SAM-dependent methyltransferase [Alphaproteobacteria bacterium]
MWLDLLLKRAVTSGDLEVTDWHGRHYHYGDGTPPHVAIRIRDAASDRRICLNPHLALGETYMDGGLIVEDGEIADLLEIVGRSYGTGFSPDPWYVRANRRLRYGLRRLQQWNVLPRAMRNVRHHYDLSGDLYDLFLDSDRQYSCAYFLNENDSLERAQEQKKRHIAAKLLIEPGMRVLDIGCGWGGMAIYLAKKCGARVTGITLSREQAKYAAERVRREGLADRIDIRIEDYRRSEGRFDRIVSVGMFEHVGVGFYPTFFRRMRELLTDRGVALLHTIARADGPGVTNPFIAKYIFPGGYIPAVSEFQPAIERNAFYLTDLEIWRLHYADTLKHWRLRFKAAWERAASLYDERFCRMWEFYLAGSEMAFRHGGHVVAQAQMSPDQTAVPLTRDYIGEFERAHPIEAN